MFYKNFFVTLLGSREFEVHNVVNRNINAAYGILIFWFVCKSVNLSIQIDCFAASDARISDGTEFNSRGAAGNSPIVNWVARVGADPEEHEVRKRGTAAVAGVAAGKKALATVSYPKHFVKCFLRGKLGGKLGVGIAKKLFPLLFGPFGKVMGPVIGKVVNVVFVPPMWKAITTKACPHVALKHSIIFG